MTKKLKLFLWIAVVALTGGCAKFDDPKPNKEEREIAMRVIETYADISAGNRNTIHSTIHFGATEQNMYSNARRIIDDYLDKAAAKID